MRELERDRELELASRNNDQLQACIRGSRTGRSGGQDNSIWLGGLWNGQDLRARTEWEDCLVVFAARFVVLLEGRHGPGAAVLPGLAESDSRSGA